MINWWKIPSPNLFHYLKVIVNTVFFKLVKISQPLFLNCITFKIILFLRVYPITMFDNNSISILSIFLLYNQPFHILDLFREFFFLFCENKKGCFNVPEISFVFYSFIYFNTCTFNERSNAGVLRLSVVFKHPNIWMKAFKVHAKDFLVIFNDGQKLLEFDLIFVFVKFHFIKNIQSISFD